MLTPHPHPDHLRVQQFALPPAAVADFLDGCRPIGVDQLQMVPFQRFMVCRALQRACGEELAETLRRVLYDRAAGCVSLWLGLENPDLESCLKLATAVAYCVGLPNFDAMTGQYYAQFAVRDTDSSDSYLRKAYRPLTLHTDGTYVAEPTDWLLMLKTAERNAVGGRSRLLHLDDWPDLEKFSTHPLAEQPLLYQAPPSKNVAMSLRRPTFALRDGRPCIAFIDQFACPESMAEAEFLHDLAASLEHSPAARSLPLRAGELLLVNNHFWLHGREAFQPHPDLFRELIRLRGRFS